MYCCIPLKLSDIKILFGALGRIETNRQADLKDDFSTDEVCAGIDALQRRLSTGNMCVARACGWC